MRTFTLVFLGLLFVIQYCSSSPQHELNKNNELYKQVVNDFVKLARPYVERFGKICEHMLETLKEHETDSDYEDVKDRLDEAVEAAKHLENSDQDVVMKYLLRSAEQLLAATFEHKEPEANKHLFYTLFNNKENEEVLEEFEKSFQEYFDGFNVEYGKNISEDENESNPDLLKWFKSFLKAHSGKNFAEQFVALVKFFNLFNPDLFLRE
uniref:Uncharacterized protein n=1 Tax=Glossina brevipalpis TaxID=37001 RepID=A0A1A9W3W9_9MUSC